MRLLGEKPSRPSSDNSEDMIKDAIEPSGKDYRTAKRKVGVFYAIHLCSAAHVRSGSCVEWLSVRSHRPVRCDISQQHRRAGVPDNGKVLEGSPLWIRASLAPGDHAEEPERRSIYVVMNLQNHSGRDLQNRSLFSVPCECLPAPPHKI